MTESYENFIKSLELPPTGSISVAFTAYHSNKSVFARGGNCASRGGHSCGNGCFQRNRPIHYQICREKGHYAIFFMTATLIPQNLPTLWSLLLRPLIDIRTLALLHT
jgi:hypothetical protein